MDEPQTYTKATTFDGVTIEILRYGRKYSYVMTKAGRTRHDGMFRTYRGAVRSAFKELEHFR